MYVQISYQEMFDSVISRCMVHPQVPKDGRPFFRNGQIVGIYENPSQAGVDVINLRRERRGTPGRVKTLRGTACWVNEAGLGIKDLMDRY